MEAFLRIAGTAVGMLAGFVTALWEVFLSPLYVHHVVVPVAPFLAVAGNVALVWFTKQVTGRTGLALLPGVVWFVTMFVGSVRTTEGDLLIPGSDWPGLVALLVGAVAWGLAAYRLILSGPRREAAAPPPPGPAAPARTPARTPAAARTAVRRRSRSGR
jgi:hypothetical protein